MSVIFLKQMKKDQDLEMARRLASLLIDHINSKTTSKEPEEKDFLEIDKILSIYLTKEKELTKMIAKILEEKYCRKFNLN